MADIIEFAARRDAQRADTTPPAAPYAPPTETLDGMLTAVSRALKSNTLDSDSRWHLVGIIMRCLGEGALKGK